MKLLMLNSFKRKRKMEEKKKASEIGTLRYYFYMRIYYSIQHLRWNSSFVALLISFQRFLLGSYIGLCINYEDYVSVKAL